jgi:hypothetical protein
LMCHGEHLSDSRCTRKVARLGFAHS